MMKAKSRQFPGEFSLSNPDKLMYPTGFAKADMLDYYVRISSFLLPYLKNRPITLKRFPEGVGGEHFYEKNAPAFTPDWVRTHPVRRASGEAMINYVLINDLATLAWGVNLANIEIHPLLAKVPYLNRPTMLVFDLDPGEGADILSACEAALLVKDLLDRLNLESFAKVSGSKGIHLHIPLNRPVTYEMTQPFARSIAQLLETENPDLVVSEMGKDKRKGRVFLDWSQNSEYKSTVAVYSLRAKADSPFVAAPVTWEEVEKALRLRDPSLLFFKPSECLARVEKAGDLFAPVLRLKQKLPKAFLDLPANPEPKTSSTTGRAGR
ncbi:MAG TPA: non-homologous end-joining DNA ligase [Terriglobales bacterium]|nr:non-homologous end-joining DNA ligase [Terriglobales bacterium]